jgi:hypothetical protein
MSDSDREAPASRPSLLAPCLIGAAYLLLHLVTITRYGYFRDALYYVACSHHLAWGYVDHPPLFVLFAWLVRHTAGVSLPALLVWPALAGVGRIVLVAAFARELGARRFGTAFAALLAAVPAVWLVVDHQFAMNAFEPLFWTGCAFVLLRMIRTQNPKLWLAFGVIVGLGLENKYSIAIWVLALLAGLLLSSQRRLLFSRWLFAGGAVALLLFLPNLLWNIRHHWPFLELMHNVRASGKDVALPPAAFLLQQARMMNPFMLPFWVGGFGYLSFSRTARPFRAFAWAFAITFAFFLLTHGKDYYMAPAYPLVLAMGGVALERLLAGPSPAMRPRRHAVFGALATAWVLLGLAVSLPVVLPVFSIEAYRRYQSHLPWGIPRTEKSQLGAALPQYWADEHGWPEMVTAVARVFDSIPPEDRAKVAILTSNYGEAAAIDFFGPRYGLPKAICPHQSYFLWGPRTYTGEIVIRVGESLDDIRSSYASVVVAAPLHNPYGFFYENRPILLCRGLKTNLQTAWPDLKKWE